MGLFDAFLLLGLFLLGIPLSWAIGAVLGRLTGLRWLERALPLTTLLLVIAGIPVALNLIGEPVSAHVVDRQERLVLNNDGEWAHRFLLSVRYLPSNPERADPVTRDFRSDSVTVSLLAGSELFDRTPVGSLVEVVYLPQRPSLAKLAGVSYLDLLARTVNQPSIRIAIAMLSLIGVAIALVGWKPRSESARGLRRAWLGACALGLLTAVVWTSIAPLFEPFDESSLTGTAEARVNEVRRVTSRGHDRARYELTHPFDVVQVEFTPPELGMPIRAADAVDVGSMAGLAEGLPVRVRYSPAAPRTIRLEGATRGFVRGNATYAGLEWLAIAALCGAALVLGLWSVHRKQRAQKPG